MFRKSLRLMSLVTACIMLSSILASAASAAVATLVSPKSKTLDGRMVDVTVSYDSESANVKIDTVVLYIDSKIYEKKRLDVPSQKGIVSFDWDTAPYSRGQHLMEVKLYAGNKIVTSVSGSGIVSDQIFDNTAPVVSFENLKDSDVISGKKVISINAKDNSGEAPIVSLLVDKKLKLMQNNAPYTYTLDTTALEDGEHFIDIYAFDNDGNQSDRISYKVVVNNGGTALANLDAPSVKVDAAPSVKAGAEVGAAREDSAGISAAVVAGGKDSSAALSAGSAGVFDKGNGAPAPVLAPAEKAGVQNEQIETASGIKTGSLQAMPVASMPEVTAEAKAAAPVSLPVAALSAVGVSQTPSAKLMARADTGKVAVSAPVDLDVPKVAEADLGTPYKVAKADISQKVALATAERTNLVLPQSGKAKIRDIVNANGGVVLWDGKTKTVTAYINNVKVEMTIGSRTIKVNGKSLTVNMIPKIQNGRTIIDVSDLK
ncbi:MAG: hypothetical protein IK083_00935, partial [Abditibacteriota bacterium]|nr:hypothetical protein [Abditibacteriota bacterium]